jgi:hypothetical protein
VDLRVQKGMTRYLFLVVCGFAFTSLELAIVSLIFFRTLSLSGTLSLSLWNSLSLSHSGTLELSLSPPIINLS